MIVRRAGLGVVAALAACEPVGDEVTFVADPNATAPLVRPDDPNSSLQFKFDAADVIETYGTTRFVVHYTRNGTNAVPAKDDDTSGVPDFVEEVGAVYEDVLDAYEALGFRPPLDDTDVTDNGGDGRFDVYLVDFAGVGDGVFRTDACEATNPQRCTGFMTQENDYVGYGYPSTLFANRVLGSHEFFHAIQAAYDTEQGSVIAEGSAVWATEQFDPTLDDFELFLPGYMDNPDRPLDEPLPGPVDPFSYGSAIFFQFLSERFGSDAVVDLWERCENDANGVADPYWLEVLEDTLAAEGSSFAEAFTEFTIWNLQTDDFADPETSYERGDGYRRVRIDIVDAPFSDDSLRVYYASAQNYAANPGGRSEVTAALVSATAAETDGLRLFVGIEDGSTFTTTEIEDPTAGTQAVSTSGADRVVVHVVNPASSGSAKKPGLCIGTVEEVAACSEALLNGGTGGGGGGGEGGQAEGGSGEGGGGDGADGADGGDDGCGCEVPGGSTRGTWMGVALVAALGALVGQRRQRRRA